VFDPEHVKEFDSFAETRVARMSAPSFGQRSKGSGEPTADQTLGLFADHDHD